MLIAKVLMPQEIGDGVFVARIDGFHHFQQIFIDVAVMGDLRLVDFLIRARFDLLTDVGDGRRGQVVAGFAIVTFASSVSLLS